MPETPILGKDGVTARDTSKRYPAELKAMAVRMPRIGVDPRHRPSRRSEPGLGHRHFRSRDELLAEAIEVGSTSLRPGAFAPEESDIDDVVHAMHHGSPSPRTITRVRVDDIAVASVRPRYPVLGGLLGLVRQLPANARPPALADPRLAATAGVSLVGSVIWGRELR